MTNSRAEVVKPVLKKLDRGLYTKCVYCSGDLFHLAIVKYNARLIGCTAVNGCGRFLPLDYQTAQNCQLCGHKPGGHVRTCHSLKKLKCPECGNKRGKHKLDCTRRGL